MITVTAIVPPHEETDVSAFGDLDFVPTEKDFNFEGVPSGDVCEMKMLCVRHGDVYGKDGVARTASAVSAAIAMWKDAPPKKSYVDQHIYTLTDSQMAV